MMKMRSYFYRFADGYFCWYASKLKGATKIYAIREHGKILEERAC